MLKGEAEVVESPPLRVAIPHLSMDCHGLLEATNGPVETPQVAVGEAEVASFPGHAAAIPHVSVHRQGLLEAMDGPFEAPQTTAGDSHARQHPCFGLGVASLPGGRDDDLPRLRAWLRPDRPAALVLDHLPPAGVADPSGGTCSPPGPPARDCHGLRVRGLRDPVPGHPALRRLQHLRSQGGPWRAVPPLRGAGRRPRHQPHRATIGAAAPELC